MMHKQFDVMTSMMDTMMVNYTQLSGSTLYLIYLACVLFCLEYYFHQEGNMEDMFAAMHLQQGQCVASLIEQLTTSLPLPLEETREAVYKIIDDIFNSIYAS